MLIDVKEIRFQDYHALRPGLSRFPFHFRLNLLAKYLFGTFVITFTSFAYKSVVNVSQCDSKWTNQTLFGKIFKSNVSLKTHCQHNSTKKKECTYFMNFVFFTFGARVSVSFFLSFTSIQAEMFRETILFLNMLFSITTIFDLYDSRSNVANS